MWSKVIRLSGCQRLEKRAASRVTARFFARTSRVSRSLLSDVLHAAAAAAVFKEYPRKLYSIFFIPCPFQRILTKILLDTLYPLSCRFQRIPTKIFTRSRYHEACYPTSCTPRRRLPFSKNTDKTLLDILYPLPFSKNTD